MRPPILYIAIALGAGLWVGLGAWGGGTWGVGVWSVGGPVLVGAALLYRRAPLGAALGIAGVAGLFWGTEAVHERAATCAGVLGRGVGEGGKGTRGAIVRLFDPPPAEGGVVEGKVVEGPCRGALRLRWPDGRPARGGTRGGGAGPRVG